MRIFTRNTYFGWFVVAGCVLVSFGVAGGQFVLRRFPETDDRGVRLEQGLTVSGLRPDLHDLGPPTAVGGISGRPVQPEAAVLSGVAVMGVILLLIPFINNLGQLYGEQGRYAEAVELTKNQILIQSATAMLAQAAAIPQNILSLI